MDNTSIHNKSMFRRALSLWGVLCATGASAAAAACFVPSAHQDGRNDCGSGTDFCNAATAICLTSYISAISGQAGQEGPLDSLQFRDCMEYDMLAPAPCVVVEDSSGIYTGCKKQDVGGEWICCYALGSGTVVSTPGLVWAPSGGDCVGQ